jgi:hypothetical protein
MLLVRMSCLLTIPVLMCADDSWKSKRAADWSDAETKQILRDSPWAGMVTPTVTKVEKQTGHRGPIVGIPGIGRRRETQDPNDTPAPTGDPGPPLNIRWESGLPIREAELKAREINAPDVEEDFYAIAVYGLPQSLTKDPQGFGDRLKGQASIKREGQKELKPNHVHVIPREDGMVVLFLFPRTKAITAADSRADFSAQIAQYQIDYSFHVDEMIYQGKPEL